MTNTENQETLAFSYVMQLLSSDEARVVATQIKEDQSLAQAVSEWEQRITSLDLSLAPQTPPPSVWQRIQTDIKQTKKAAAPKKFLSGIWGWSGAIAGFASIALLAFVLFFQNPYQSNLDQQWMVSANLKTGNITLAALQPTPMGKGKVCTLWIKDDHSTMKVGELPMKGIRVINVKNNPNIYDMFTKKAILLISVESVDHKPSAPSNTTVQGDWL